MALRLRVNLSLRQRIHREGIPHNGVTNFLRLRRFI